MKQESTPTMDNEDKIPEIAFMLNQKEFGRIYMALIHPEYVTELPRDNEHRKTMEIQQKEIADKLITILQNWRAFGTYTREDGVVVMPRFAYDPKSYKECNPFCYKCKTKGRVICDDGHIANEYFRRNHKCPTC
jgi:hypothetical protein